MLSSIMGMVHGGSSDHSPCSADIIFPVKSVSLSHVVHPCAMVERQDPLPPLLHLQGALLPGELVSCWGCRPGNSEPGLEFPSLLFAGKGGKCCVALGVMHGHSCCHLPQAWAPPGSTHRDKCCLPSPQSSPSPPDTLDTREVHKLSHLQALSSRT